MGSQHSQLEAQPKLTDRLAAAAGNLKSFSRSKDRDPVGVPEEQTAEDIEIESTGGSHGTVGHRENSGTLASGHVSSVSLFYFWSKWLWLYTSKITFAIERSFVVFLLYT